MYKRSRPELKNPRLKEAFGALNKVWSGESTVMMSDLPLFLDDLNLLANVHIQTEVERLKPGYKELWTQTFPYRVYVKGGDKNE